jgi:hypothetical protein
MFKVSSGMVLAFLNHSRKEAKSHGPHVQNFMNPRADGGFVEEARLRSERRYKEELVEPRRPNSTSSTAPKVFVYSTRSSHANFSYP